jgi:DNA-binding beta-propeller fold protein YncE
MAWPAAPAAPRARLVQIIPDPAAPPAARRWWVTLGEWVTGATFAAEAEEGLRRPFGVAVAADGAVMVSDADAGRVLAFRDGQPPAPIRCAAAEWSSPLALLAGPDGTLWVADAGLGAVARLRAGECRLLGVGELERPTGLALVGGRLVVADAPRHALLVLSPEGEVLARWTGRGDDPFAFPTSLAAAGDGLVLTDAFNFRVVRLDGAGRPVQAFGGPGDDVGAFTRPKGIAVDGDGRIYVSDAQRDLVLVYSAAGEWEYAIGEPGDGPGQFALPSGLAVAGDRLLVADSQNRRIQVFELIGGRP